MLILTALKVSLLLVSMLLESEWLEDKIDKYCV